MTVHELDWEIDPMGSHVFGNCTCFVWPGEDAIFISTTIEGLAEQFADHVYGVTLRELQS